MMPLYPFRMIFGSGVMGLLVFLGLLALALFVLLIIWLVNSSRGEGAFPGIGREPDYRGDRSPLDVIRERYARGEITREQYLEMRQDLEPPAPPPPAPPPV